MFKKLIITLGSIVLIAVLVGTYFFSPVLSAGSGFSAMYASARDWARLGQFCLQGGQWQGEQLLPGNWLSYSTTPTPNNALNNYGAHFWLNADPEDRQQKRTWPSLPADTFSMNGYQGQRVVIIPSMDLVVVRLGFSAGKKRGIEQLVAGVIEVLAL